MAGRRKCRRATVMLVSPTGVVLAVIRTGTTPPRVEVHPYPTPAQQMEIAAWLGTHVHPNQTHEAVRQLYFGEWPSSEGEPA